MIDVAECLLIIQGALMATLAPLQWINCLAWLQASSADSAPRLFCPVGDQGVVDILFDKSVFAFEGGADIE